MTNLPTHYFPKNLISSIKCSTSNNRAIKGTSLEKLYQELGLEYLYERRWARRFRLLYQVFLTGQPSYIYDVPMRSSRWHVNSFNLVSCTSEYFKNSFIPNAIYEWNKLDPDIERNGKTFSVSCGYVLGDKFSWELPFCKVRCFYLKKKPLIIMNKHWARSRKFVNN